MQTDSGGGPGGDVHSGSSGVTLRENTERPETVDVGANMLVGAKAGEMLKGTKQLLTQGSSWTNPFGDGKTSNLILDLLKIL